MANPDTIGVLELSSVAVGYQVEDAMLKAANVELVVGRTICSGKYLVAVAGDTSGVTASVEAGSEIAPEGVIENRVIPNVHPAVFPAISGVAELTADQVGALGIVETFSASSIIDCADAAAKAGEVTLFRVHLAMALGGKGFLLITGSVGSVQAAVDAAVEVAAETGILVGSAIIPRPREELFKEYI